MEFQPKFSENNIEKPKFLYHGTPQIEIESVSPRTKNFSTEKKEFIFASPDRKVAISYMAKGDYSWSTGIYNGEYFIVLPITRDNFIEQDKGGAVYTFDSKNFRTNEDRKDYEWVSEQEEKPVQKETFSSVLEIIESEGISIYFLDTDENYNKYYSIKQASKRAAHEFLKNFRK